ncbi:MAG: alpha/beta fold hydrolase [Candidatus Eremiobacteraeota bacterium]|nr:alpha/beta fold hydrolase [Candidatus Eremiobacteraeota bacterium]
MSDVFTGAQRLLERILERDHDQVGEAGRTLALIHAARTARSAVLFHGLSASPMQFVQIARGLHERGYNVIVPRLPRHGYADRMSDAQATMRADDLKATALAALEAARGLGERVTVAGFSLGGLLAAWAAQTQEIEHAVPIAPFLGIAFVPSRFGANLTRAALYLPNVFNWWDPVLREKQMPAHGYPRYATHALAQAMLLSHELFEAAATAPPKARSIMLVTNSHEAAVNNRAARKLAGLWHASKSSGFETYQFTDLPISHDIIEPLHHPEIVEKVYPILIELLDR